MAKIVNVGELLDSPDREVHFYADKLIPAKGLTIVAGESGIGKSHLLLAVLMSMASHTEALGALETEPVNILVFAEDDDYILRPYVKRIGKNFPNLDRALLNFVPEPEGYWEFADKLRETRPAVAVIDPIIALGGITDSSRDTEVSKFLRDLKKLSNETGASIVFTRHLNKADAKVVYNEENIFNRISGSYAWKSTTYHRLVMWKDKDYRFRLSCSSKLGPDYHWHINCDLENGMITVDGDVGVKKKKVSKWRLPIMHIAEKYKDTFMLPGAMAQLITQELGVEGVNKDAIRKEMKHLARDGNLVPRADAKGTSYKYSVGMGEALVVSAESNWPSPVDLSEQEDEVDHDN